MIEAKRFDQKRSCSCIAATAPKGWRKYFCELGTNDAACGFVLLRTFPIQKDTCSVIGLLGRVMREHTSDILAEPLPIAIMRRIAVLQSVYSDQRCGCEETAPAKVEKTKAQP